VWVVECLALRVCVVECLAVRACVA